MGPLLTSPDDVTRSPFSSDSLEFEDLAKIGGKQGYSKDEGSKANRGSGGLRHMVAGALAGVHRRGGGQQHTRAAMNRKRENQLKAWGGSVAHGERGGVLGEARGGSTAANRAGRSSAGGGVASIDSGRLASIPQRRRRRG